MATSEFVEIASFANAVEADQIRSVLAESGIGAFVDGANAGTALSHVGSALGGVRLFVRAHDADRAKEILDSLRDESNLSAEAWFCGECEEEVDGDFQVCWSCGQERAEVERPFPAAKSDEPIHEEHSAPYRETDDDTDYDHTNPYVAPYNSPEMTPDEPPGEIDPEAEAILLRAWRASVLGTIFFPFFTHLYSMYLLIRASMLNPHFSPEGKRRFYLSLIINVFFGCLLAWIFGLMFSR